MMTCSRNFLAVVALAISLMIQEADAKMGICATKMLASKRDESCFLAGVASMKGYHDDDDTTRTHGSTEGDPYQCIDCLLDTPGCVQSS